MKCPFCGYEDSRVVDSREVNEGIRRRRECLRCEDRFTTYERVQPVSLFVKKKDGRREVFDREKVVAGVRKACGKRPLPAQAADDVADEVEARLYGLGRAEVPSRVIGDLVMRRLKDKDHIAYIRFASIYREFADITALKEEIETLLDAEGHVSASAEQLPLLPDERLGAQADGALDRAMPRQERKSGSGAAGG